MPLARLSADPPPFGAPRLHALIPCAGLGRRAGAGLPKQYAALGERCMIAHTLAALASVPRLDTLLVVLHPDDADFERRVPGFEAEAARCGGASRALTVAGGLAELRRRGAVDHDWVLVHDAARCLIRAESVDALIDACLDDPVGGLLALPLADTLKSERAGRVEATIDRRAKWLAQTPQMFRLRLLGDALAAAGPEVTDEAGAVEALGLAPRLVPGPLENFKVTHAADFALAERLLASRR